MGAVFSTLMKNAYLDALVKGTAVSSTYQLNNKHLRFKATAATVFTATFTSILPVTSGFPPPVAGVSSFDVNITPTASGTVTDVDIWDGSSTSHVTGVPSLAGNGGMAIVGSMAFVNATPVNVKMGLKVPLHAGGTLRFNEALANAWANSMLYSTLLPSMANNGSITIYSGTQPADADEPVPEGAVALWTTSFLATDFSAAGSGQSNLSVAKAASCVATGTATWARWVRGNLTIDGSVGTTGADFIVDSDAFVSGQSRTITAIALVFP